MKAPEQKQEAVFDGFADQYDDLLDRDLKLAGADVDHFALVKVERLLDACRRLLGPAETLTFLDVGCGTGVSEVHLLPHARRVVGVDVSASMVEVARRRCPTGEFFSQEPGRLPFADATFDVSFCCCVLHHVPPAEREGFVAEMRRVTRPGGLLFTFEHNPLNPVTRYIVHHCPVDEEAILLGRGEACRLLSNAGDGLVEACYYLFFPGPLGFLRPLERLMGWLPLGGQFYVVARRSGAAS